MNAKLFEPDPWRFMLRPVRLALVLVVVLIILGHQQSAKAADAPLKGVSRLLFLGDSITYSGQFVEYVEAMLRIQNPEFKCEILNVGLPSETVSGLTEPGHASGKFPRPDLHERLDRVLEMSKPDLVIVCYGMNDGIYYPYAEDRARKFQEGIRFVHSRIEAAGAKVLHLTPPVFDPVPLKERTLPAGLAEYRQPYRGYDDVLERYSKWLLDQKDQGWDVIDIHGPLRQYLDTKRTRDPGFQLAGDGVHMGPAGHWIVARAILSRWGVPAPDLEVESGEEALGRRPHGPEVLKLVQKRQRLLKDAWLTATRHTRPGMKVGVSLPEANQAATAIDAEIVALIGPGS